MSVQFLDDEVFQICGPRQTEGYCNLMFRFCGKVGFETALILPADFSTLS